MKFYRKGDSGRAVCESCEKLVTTTFDYRDVPFSDGNGVAKGILAAVCDTCGAVVATPPQSTPAIQRAREAAVKPIEASFPAPVVEILDLALYRISPTSGADFRKHLLMHFALKLAAIKDPNETARSLLVRYESHRSEWKNQPRRRLSFKLSPKANKTFDELQSKTNLNRTQLISGLIMKIEQDIVAPEVPKNLKELSNLATVVQA